MIITESAAATRRGRCGAENQDRFFAGAEGAVAPQMVVDVTQMVVDVLWPAYYRGVSIADELRIDDIRKRATVEESPRCVADRLAKASPSASGRDDAFAIVLDVGFACFHRQEQPPWGLSRLRRLRAA